MSTHRGVMIMMAGIFLGLSIGQVVHQYAASAVGMPIYYLHCANAGLCLGSIIFLYGGRSK